MSASRIPAVGRIASVKRLWSNDEFWMANFLAQHGQRIPVIIFITEGYSGIDELHSVSVEDVRYGSSPRFYSRQGSAWCNFNARDMHDFAPFLR